jgi:alanine transaminase
VDTIERAKKLYAEIGSVGAYTHSKGVKEIRERVARFIERESDFDEMRVGSVGRSVG